MSDEDLIRGTCETYARYLELGNEAFSAAGATFVRNLKTPDRYDANHVHLIRSGTADDIESLFSRAEAEFAGLGHRRFDVDPLTPPQVVARLELEGGFSTTDTLQLVLEGELQARPKEIEIREVVSEEDWQAYGALDRLWAGEDVRPWSEWELEQSLTSRRFKAPQVRGWLAIADGVPRAMFSSWPGENGVGMVEDLYTHRDYRHRGLATALIARCVADARERGAGPVLIGADPAGTPKRMYAAMGFRPLMLTRNYLRTVDARGP